MRREEASLARLLRAILAAICLVYMKNQSFELDTVTHALHDHVHDALLDATVRLTDADTSGQVT